MSYPLTALLPPKFPRRLKEIPDPPEKLYCAGTLPPESHTFLTVVGARRYTSYGKTVLEKLVAGLRGYPVVIVSGLALGIDAVAHEAALRTGLATVAVPGSGLDPDVIYPRTNQLLAKRILESGGALISEFEPAFRATPWSFPQRNRIMAGLADAILVVEAEKRSGTLITARLATEYNRTVLTVPASIFSATAEGPHLLLRMGATPITSSAELLDALGFEAAPSSGDKTSRYGDCSAEEHALIDLLKAPLSRDEIIRRSGLSASRANTILAVLELKGLTKENLGEIHLA